MSANYGRSNAPGWKFTEMNWDRTPPLRSEPCQAKECGTCVMCRDMLKRGGKGMKRQPCVRRVCVNVKQGGEERAAEKLANMERDRERREAARQTRIEMWAAEKLQRQKEREAAKEAKIAERAAAQLAKERAHEARALLRKPSAAWRSARTPEHPTELAAYGWGAARTYPAGAP